MSPRISWEKRFGEMKKTRTSSGHRRGTPLGIILLTALGSTLLGACYSEPEVKPDSHSALVNPFVGKWQAGEDYYEYREDGTGGASSTRDGPFGDEFSYFIWYGEGLGNLAKHNTLVTAGGDAAGLTASNAEINQYAFTVNPNGTITVTPQTLTGPQSNGTYKVEPNPAAAQVYTPAGAPQAKPLSVDNPLIGEWHAVWNGVEHDGSNSTWSYKFRTDGTVRTYHHGLHQFDNGYLLRGNILVILGEWRFNDNFGYISSTVTVKDGGSIAADEKDHGELHWDFTRVTTAEWK
jgi:hypothetical protein